MKLAVFLASHLVALGLWERAAIAAAEHPIRLTGIVVLSGKPVALLETPGTLPLASRLFQLGEGQREGEVEVRRIDPLAGKVKVNLRGAECDLGFSESAPTMAEKAAVLRFEKTALDQALAVYADLVERTLLRPSSLPDTRLDLLCPAQSTVNDMASAIEGALAERGVLTRGAHEKFAVVVAQESDFGKLTPPLWDLAVRLGARDGQTLAPGMVNFPDTDLSQVLRFYQELVGRTIVRPATLPAGTVRLKTRARHTYPEVVYALNATLALNNLSILPAGENFLLVVPNHQTNQAAKLVARVKAPAASPADPGNGATAMDFRGTSLAQVVAFYGKLCGQPARLGPSTPQPLLFLQSAGMLSPEAMRQGIELLLGVNGLAVVPDDTGPGLKIVPMALAEK